MTLRNPAAVYTISVNACHKYSSLVKYIESFPVALPFAYKYLVTQYLQSRLQRHVQDRITVVTMTIMSGITRTETMYLRARGAMLIDICRRNR
jgi:hypothetical protein